MLALNIKTLYVIIASKGFKFSNNPLKLGQQIEPFGPPGPFLFAKRQMVFAHHHGGITHILQGAHKGGGEVGTSSNEAQAETTSQCEPFLPHISPNNSRIR